VWHKKTVIQFIVISLLIISFLSIIPTSHAVLPTVTGTCSPLNNVNVCSPLTTQANDVIIVEVEIASSSASVVSVTSVTDGGDTFTQQISKTVLAPADFSNPFPAKVEIWSALHASGVSVTITILLSGGTVAYNLQSESVSNISPTVVATATGSCVADPGICGTVTTSSSNKFSNGNSFAVAATGGWGMSTPSQGTGFIPIPNPCVQFCSEYSASITSPTNYPMSCASCGATNFVAVALAGAIFSLVPPGASTVFSTIFVTTTVSNGMNPCTETNSCTTNQFSSFMIILLPSIIMIALAEYATYKVGAKDERIYSSTGAFGQWGIPWYIPVFCDIIGFMLIATFKGNSGGI
jgi:hypothetical protein